MQNSSRRDVVGHLSRVLAVLAIALVVLLGAGTPAARAHDKLVATTPEADAAVPDPPVSVTLEFSRAVQPLGTQVVVTGPDGAPVSEGAAETREATVVQALTTDVSAGRYTVSWRVTSSDGHPITGEFAFTVEGEPAASASSPTEPAAEATAGPTADAEVSEAAAPRPAESSLPLGPLAIGAGLVVVAGLVFLLRRRRT